MDETAGTSDGEANDVAARATMLAPKMQNGGNMLVLSNLGVVTQDYRV